MAPRLRKAPLSERVKACLNPQDWLLWISEEISSNEWDDFLNQCALPIGVAFNFIFLIARSNSQPTPNSGRDDVFGDFDSRGSGWLKWFASFLVHGLTAASFANSFYAFVRKRYYRLFEAPVDAEPTTPSAHRVHVDSSPLSSSPVRYLSRLIALPKAESRAHPDAVRDVWELALWDPKSFNLRLFCLFSPGHVFIYWLLLPLKPLDPRPSVTVVTAIALIFLLSAELFLLLIFFSRQSKDKALINKQVQHEYNTKFVHPSLNRPVRDVGTQIVTYRTPMETPEVLTYTPTSFVNRGFRTNPNPAYASHFDPDSAAATPRAANQAQRIMRSITTPTINSSPQSAGFSSPIRADITPGVARQTQFRSSAAGTPSAEGGSFGIYSHAQSPLKRPSASGDVHAPRQVTKLRREGSPLKRTSLSGSEQLETPQSSRRDPKRQSWL